MKKNDLIYLYDGTFEGLLTIIYELLKQKIIPLDIKEETNYQVKLLEETFYLSTDLNKYHVLENKIAKISNLTLYNVYNTFLSNDEHKELIIFYYVLNALKYGTKINNLRNLNCVLKTQKLSKYVTGEAHRLKGFLRFKATANNVLYAEIGPNNDVVEILAKHFSKRLKNELWIIKDVNRNKMAFYNKKKYLIVNNSNINFMKPNFEQEEKDMESIWQGYYKSMAIKERTNLRCQMTMMPKRYWKYLVEMETNNENA